MFSKKGLSSLVAIIGLFLFILIVIVGFQKWNLMEQNRALNEDLSLNERFSIEYVMEGFLFFNSEFESIEITKITLEDVDCSISGTYTKGDHNLDIRSCISDDNEPYPEVIVYTNKGIYLKVVNLDNN